VEPINNPVQADQFVFLRGVGVRYPPRNDRQNVARLLANRDTTTVCDIAENFREPRRQRVEISFTGSLHWWDHSLISVLPLTPRDTPATIPPSIDLMRAQSILARERCEHNQLAVSNRKFIIKRMHKGSAS
jgi:hypothetical protein